MSLIGCVQGYGYQKKKLLSLIIMVINDVIKWFSPWMKLLMSIIGLCNKFIISDDYVKIYEYQKKIIMIINEIM